MQLVTGRDTNVLKYTDLQEKKTELRVGYPLAGKVHHTIETLPADKLADAEKKATEIAKASGGKYLGVVEVSV